MGLWMLTLERSFFFSFLFFLFGHSFIYSHKKLDYNIKKNINNNIAPPPRLMGERGRKKKESHFVLREGRGDTGF